jgi:hypothetical protein
VGPDDAMMAVGPEGDARVSRLEIDLDYCGSRKFVAELRVSVTAQRRYPDLSRKD